MDKQTLNENLTQYGEKAKQFIRKNIWVARYIPLAFIVGILVGIICYIFGQLLLLISGFRSDHYLILTPFLPLAGLLIVFLYRKISPESLKGMTLVFEVGQRKRDSIPLLLIPLVMVCTWITHLFGGSAGREGVAVQIGGTLSHFIGRLLRVKEDKSLMLIIGMAAGFGGLFQTPLTGVFFALEVLYFGYLEYTALLPALIAAFTASFTSHLIGLEKFSVDLPQSLGLTDFKSIICIVLLGICFGLAGRLFSFLLRTAKKYAGELIKNPYIRIGAVSVVLVLCLIFIHGGRYSGLGTNLINASFNGSDIYFYDWFLKIIFTVVTLAIGFQGGEVTPLFSIGASLGILLGWIFGLPLMACAALGYAAVFGSATNTLIAPIMIGVEVFGGANAAPFIVVCVIAYLVNGNHSIYGAQARASLL